MPNYEEIYNKHGIILIKGDCQEYLSTLDDNETALILSDPPYGHSNNDGDLIHQLEKAIPARRNKSDFAERRNSIERDRAKGIHRANRKDLVYDARPIANDGAEANVLVKWIIEESKRLLVKGGNIALCCSGGGGPGTIEYANWSIWMDQALQFKQMIIWDKEGLGIGWHYRRNYEVVLVATKPGAACKWYDETDKIPNVIRAGVQGIRRIIPQADEHPCLKPVELMQFFIRLHTKPGDLVIDPFCGSGTTAVACRMMKRRCIGVELDPHWCRVAVDRVKNAGSKIGFGIDNG